MEVKVTVNPRLGLVSAVKGEAREDLESRVNRVASALCARVNYRPRGKLTTTFSYEGDEDLTVACEAGEVRASWCKAGGEQFAPDAEIRDAYEDALSAMTDAVDRARKLTKEARGKGDALLNLEVALYAMAYVPVRRVPLTDVEQFYEVKFADVFNRLSRDLGLLSPEAFNLYLERPAVDHCLLKDVDVKREVLYLELGYSKRLVRVRELKDATRDPVNRLGLFKGGDFERPGRTVRASVGRPKVIAPSSCLYC